MPIFEPMLLIHSGLQRFSQSVMFFLTFCMVSPGKKKDCVCNFVTFQNNLWLKRVLS
jgi:hypothetical protein